MGCAGRLKSSAIPREEGKTQTCDAGGGDAKALGFKAEIEKRYGITMKKVTNSEDGTEYIYEGLATIGGKQVEIMMNCYKQGINIIYALPD